MIEPFQVLGIPKEHGILVVADHASNHVPEDIDLGISPQWHDDHICYDIGTQNVAEFLSERNGFTCFCANHSRLVVDLNRYPDERSVVPELSDAVTIPGNALSSTARANRVDKYHHPYHDRLRELIKILSPSLVLSLHSFSPVLRTDPQLTRPWDMGILYNEYETASRLALQYSEDEDLILGDQLPYSGKQLNATMNRQCEAIGQPYFGVEIRQDLIMDDKGQHRFADILQRICEKIATALA